ncbi:cupin domain-containing protein [Phenylobacterium sp.]|jgi:uncharacterized cupin superfamily protein|uniref:cupin domain-containing protein n=1 Tax=Phenylobacterium sp. TaxID=1871053 RepID=UPI002F95DDB7
MPKIDIDKAPVRTGSAYPAPFHEPCLARHRQKLGDAAGLTQFGVNLMTLKPGGWSSQRHWHTAEDEFVWVLEGEVELVTDEGAQTLRAGECAAFRAGEPNGHHLINRSDRDARLLEIGTRSPDDDHCDYPDLDMIVGPDSVYRHRDGTPYPDEGGRKR